MVVLLPRDHEHHSCKTTAAHRIQDNKPSHWDELPHRRHSGNEPCPAALRAMHPVHTRRCGHSWPCVASQAGEIFGSRPGEKQVPSTELGEERGVADCDALVRMGGSSPVTSQISCLQTGQNSVEGGIPMQKLSGTSRICFQGGHPNSR